ncbi:uncharacterized protein LOC127076240 [Lathyrus oleraceus]|uniref:Uncharacterized protein n=1 Tax=Pisum sativum TaxID=3888 RepID=A0A9D5AXI5_PEA|nr:uncharacterized protein LOC127076240 [Pisum sativum]KAI5422330.1 hypothetical protein KIW84_045688 [Pisum sativum]
MRGGKRTMKKEDDEVEQMLRAAQDEILLNLSLNSHLSRPSPSSSTILHPDPDLDLDLERRFQALKSNSKNQQPLDPSTRFDALKAKSHHPVNANDIVSASEPPFQYEESDEEDEEAQIQKLIEWAKDAARLDPSPPSPAVSDDEDDEPSVSDDGDDEDDDRRKSLK